MMKVALTAVLALGLAACGGDNSANNAAETNAENAAITDVNAATNDTAANADVALNADLNATNADNTANATDNAAANTTNAQ